MTRLSTNNAAAAAGLHVPYAAFADFDFVSGHLYLTSWDRNYAFGGNTYLSLGKFCQIPEIVETTDLVAQSVQFTLSATDQGAAPLSTALTEIFHNRSAKLYVGWLTQDLTALVDTPYLLWEGSMDTMPIESSAGSSMITLVCEPRLLLLDQMAGWMYTDDHQRQLGSSTDNFFNLVTSLVNKTVMWGATSVDQGSAGTGGSPSQNNSNSPANYGRY